MSNSKRCLLILILSAGLIIGCSDPDLDVRRADRLKSSFQKSSDDAVHLYQRAVKSYRPGPKKDAARLKLARLYFQTADFSKAIPELRQLSNKEGMDLLARALYKNADYTGALEVFNKVGARQDPEYLYFYGLTLEKNNLYDQALRIYSLIKSDSFGAKAKERMAAISLDSGPVAFSGIEDEVKKLILNSPGQEEYPEAAGLYLLSDENFSLTEDNRLVSDSHYVIKILNDRGKEKFAEVALDYDSTYEKLDLIYARTIRPDGTVVTVGDKNIRDVSMYLNFPMYSNARVRIVSMPEVSAGCVIEYRVKIYRSQLPNKKDFDLSYWLQSDDPILLERCAISVPQSKNLRHKIVNAAYNTFGFEMTPKVREEKGRKIFSVEFKNVPQIIPEPGMPSIAKINPYILFSSFNSWQELSDWWRSLYKDKVTPDEDIKANVKELIKDKLTPDEKIRALYNFCAQKIRYVAVEYGDAGYEPHKASEIFKNKYGDCKDKAILLIAMLNAAGIEAYPVLISTSDSLDVQEDMPTLLFNHAIAAVKISDKLIFMDATANTVSFSDLPLGDQDRKVLVFFKEGSQLIRTPLFAPEHNKVLTRMKIKLNKNEGIDAEREVNAQGVFLQAQRYWLTYTMPALIEEGLKQKVRLFADKAVLKQYKIENALDLDKPVLLKYTFSAPQYLVRAGRARIMDHLGGMDTSLVVKDSRRYPIESPGLAYQEDIIEVELPTHLAVKYLPVPVEVETKWFYFLSRYEVIDKKDIRFSFVNKIKERVVSVEEYPVYKKSIEDIAMLVNQQVVLEEK